MEFYSMLVLLIFSFPSISARWQNEPINEKVLNFLEETSWRAKLFFISASCPSNCTCIDVFSSKTIFLLCKKGLENLPPHCPSTTRIFSYTNSRVPNDALTKSSFANCSTVNILNLSNNNIVNIDEKAFEPISNLVKLFLDNNPFITKHTISFLPFLSPMMQVLSLKNVLATNTPTKCLWTFLTSEGSFTERLNNTNRHMTSLTELRLDDNRLISIDVAALTRNSLFTTLKTLGLSANEFTEDKILVFFEQLQKTLLQREVLEEMWKRDIFAKYFDVHKNVSAKKTFYHKYSLKINLSQNLISTFNSNTLNFINMLMRSQFHLNISSYAQVLMSLKLQLQLKNNPWNCSCGANILQKHILSEIVFIEDWNSLKCLSPFKLKGIPIQTINSLPRHIKVCEEELDRSTTQLVFIVLTTIILSIVMLIVAVLNRNKFLSCYNLIKDCGEDDNATSTLRWKNNLDKYTIPSEHNCAAVNQTQKNDAKKSENDNKKYNQIVLKQKHSANERSVNEPHPLRMTKLKVEES